jgi:hypothetical protein
MTFSSIEKEYANNNPAIEGFVFELKMAKVIAVILIMYDNQDNLIENQLYKAYLQILFLLLISTNLICLFKN